MNLTVAKLIFTPCILALVSLTYVAPLSAVADIAVTGSEVLDLICDLNEVKSGHSARKLIGLSPDSAFASNSLTVKGIR